MKCKVQTRLKRVTVRGRIAIALSAPPYLGKRNCQTEGVTYTIKWLGEICTRRKVYKGETASNADTRGGEQLRRLGPQDLNSSPLWRHCVEEHGVETQQSG